MNVLNLGSGYDTTLYWLAENHPQLCEKMTWVEIDFDQVVERKIQIIKKTESINSIIRNNKYPDRDYMLDSDNYKIFSHDIRQTESLGLQLKDFGVSPEHPTIVLTECLLIYLKNEDSEKILRWIGEFFAPSPYVSILNYEMIHPNDPFGQTMLNNLRDRGCDLLGIEGCPDVNSQINRMN